MSNGSRDAASRYAQEAATWAREGKPRKAGGALAEAADNIGVPPLRFVADLKRVKASAVTQIGQRLIESAHAVRITIVTDEEGVDLLVGETSLGRLRAPDRDIVTAAQDCGVTYSARILELAVRDGAPTVIVELRRDEMHPCRSCGLNAEAAFAYCEDCRTARKGAKHERPIPVGITDALANIARDD